jgi:protein phosphatase
MTHIGRVRPNNEDVFLALEFDEREVRYLGKTGEGSLAGADFIFAVSDGMGGAKSGEFASRFAIDRITRLLPREFRHLASAKDAAEILAKLFAAIHADMLKLGFSYDECSGMGATLSLAWLTPAWLHFAHLGDSRIYHLPRKSGCTQLTDDHTHVGWLHRQGQLNEREARSHPMRNALHQALGAGHQFAEPHLGAVEHTAGDRFLICSDGVTDGLWNRELDELIRLPPPERAAQPPAQRIVESAVAQSGRDNTTAVVIEILPASPS